MKEKKVENATGDSKTGRKLEKVGFTKGTARHC